MVAGATAAGQRAQQAGTLPVAPEPNAPALAGAARPNPLAARRTPTPVDRVAAALGTSDPRLTQGPAARNHTQVKAVIRRGVVRHQPFEGVVAGYKCSVVLRGEQRPRFEVTPVGGGAALSNYRDLDDHFNYLVADLD